MAENKKSGNCETKKVKRQTSRDEECPICYELMTSKNSVKTNCNHTFHKKCLEKQCLVRPICPLCRQDITLNCKIIKLTNHDINIISTILDRFDYTNATKEQFKKNEKELKFIKLKLRNLNYDVSYTLSNNAHAYALTLKTEPGSLYVQALDKVIKYRQGQENIFQ